jgi:DNA-directed RNA polymerase subunit RPC12/RpoP
MENLGNKHIIRCPYCDAEYFPSEIFIPKNFVGTARHMGRDASIGTNMDLVESYTCDSCGNIFITEACVSFVSVKSKINTFDEDF